MSEVHHQNRAHERRTRPDTERSRELRAAERVRYAVRTGKVSKPEVCDDCGADFPKLAAWMPDTLRPLDGVRFLCDPCHQVRRPRRRPVQRKRRKQNIKKLPPYAEMRRMLLPPRMGGQGMTYREMAAKYGVHLGCVVRTFRDRTLAHGDPWPPMTQQDARDRARRSMMRNPRSVRIDVIWSLVEEYLYDNRMSVREFSRHSGLGYDWLYSIRAGKYKRVTKPLAAQMLRSIGEPVPAWMDLPAPERVLQRVAS